jgi:sortase (surface protein transpeptidase)
MKTASSFTELYEQLKLRLVPFTVGFFVVTFLTYLVLYVADVYPEPVTNTVPESETASELSDEPVAARAAVATQPSTEVVVPTPIVEVSPYPTSITFDELDQTVAVLNPTSPEYSALDAALSQGVVRHPQSADFADTGNMVILGHSSYLPNVLNRNYQAFNGIENLDWGDIVRVLTS